MRTGLKGDGGNKMQRETIIELVVWLTVCLIAAGLMYMGYRLHPESRTEYVNVTNTYVLTKEVCGCNITALQGAKIDLLICRYDMQDLRDECNKDKDELLDCERELLGTTTTTTTTTLQKELDTRGPWGDLAYSKDDMEIHDLWANQS